MQRFRFARLCAAVLVAVLGTAAPAAGAALPQQRGIAHASLWWDDYATARSDRLLAEIADSGATWVQLVPTWYQSTPSSSGFAPRPPSSDPTATSTASDDSVRAAVATAHAVGLQVLLKPHIDVLDGSWRGEIDPEDRDAWFADYTRFIAGYADLAQSAGVDQFAVGTELAALSGDTQRWREVIAVVRDRYRGPLTYAANHDEYAHVQFWDALDLIGVDAYFSLPGGDVAALVAAWEPRLTALERVSAHWNRPILFTEAGYANRRDATDLPWALPADAVRDDGAQAVAYDALLHATRNRPWFAGVFWWRWEPIGSAPPPIEFFPLAPARAVLRAHWSPAG